MAISNLPGRHRCGTMRMLFISTMLSMSTLIPYATAKQSKLAARSEFMQAMKSSGLSKTVGERDRRKRMNQELMKKAIPASQFQNRQLNNNADDAYYPDYGNFGFDATAYSLKYAGCSAIKTYSDELAEQNEQDNTIDTVFATMTFVIFRFCPSDTCSDDSRYGCTYNYGEYMIPMKDWLETISQYREESLERYCKYCEQCMAKEYYNNNADDANNADGDDNNNRRLEDTDDAAANAGDAAEHACEAYDACYNYAETCAEDNGDDKYKVEYENYFECQKYKNNYGKVFYLGPHCLSDKNTIIIGVFEDQWCSVYASDYSAAKITGLSFSDDGLAEYYKSDCVPCKISAQAWVEEDENGDGQEDDQVSEYCENLYDASAKCNIHIGESEYSSSKATSDSEEMTCSFIQSVVTGHYDEEGYIYIDAGSYMTDNEKNEYAQDVTRVEVVSIGQIFGLLFFSLGLVVLSIWACFLHRSIAKKAPWKGHQQSSSSALAGHISRQNSGIVLGRSRSGGSYHGGQMA